MPQRHHGDPLAASLAGGLADTTRLEIQFGLRHWNCLVRKRRLESEDFRYSRLGSHLFSMSRRTSSRVEVNQAKTGDEEK